MCSFFFFQAEDGIRDYKVTGVQTCALPIFTPAISLFVNCETQPEVDELWKKLSAGGRQDQCGWLQDKYGLSWQIIPTALGGMFGDKDPEKAHRAMQAMLKMEKIDIKGLQQAYDGK